MGLCCCFAGGVHAQLGLFGLGWLSSVCIATHMRMSRWVLVVLPWPGVGSDLFLVPSAAQVLSQNGEHCPESGIGPLVTAGKKNKDLRLTTSVLAVWDLLTPCIFK